MSLKPYYQTDLGVLYHGDCLDILPLLDQVDLVLTDPPYGLGDKWNGGKTKWPLHHGEMSWDKEPFKHIEKIINIGKYQIIWGGHLYDLPISRAWLIWDKLERNDKFTSGQAEIAWTNLDRPIRVFRRCSTGIMSKGKQHPTQKPIELILWCFNFVVANSVIDPFIGSGTTAIACERLNLKWIGIEISEKYCEIAAKRIEKERTQLKLFPKFEPEQPKMKQASIF